MIDVSIVIVSYNTAAMLDECIASVKRETDCSYEIIVVDNDSRDGSREMLREKYPEVSLLENSSNVGFARANNQGFELAQGRYFFMLNSDTVILDKAIDKLVAFMQKNPSVGICGPRNVAADGSLQYNCDHFPSLWDSLCVYAALGTRFPEVPFFNRSRMLYWDYAEQRCVERIMGCSLLIAASDYKKVGGLDGNYFMYFEETDLCFQLKRMGKDTVYFPEASIIHYGGGSSVSNTSEPVLNKTVMSYFLRSKYYFFRKNYGYMRMLYIRVLDFAYGLVLCIRNARRSDASKRNHGMVKGNTLLAGAITEWK